MPELPEVETVVRGLQKCAIGLTISSVAVTLPRIAVPSADFFISTLPGCTIIACTRRAKYIVLHLSDERRLLVHLRMTGRLMFVPASSTTLAHDPQQAEIPRYTHATLTFTSGAKLHFADARTFGRLRLVDPGELWDAELGVEPLADDFSARDFTKLIRSRRGPIKNVLLDQHLLVGIGNIYACEALWQAQIPPHTPACDLTLASATRLYDAIRDVLQRAIDLRGTSARDYVDAEGLKGGFQNVLAVYGRHGQPCQTCGTEIVRVVIAQRGTWFCATCQPTRKRKAVARL